MRLLKDKKAIDRTLVRLAYEISDDILNDFVIIGIKKRGYPLALRLKNNLENIIGHEITIGSINISLYQNDLSIIANEPIIHDFDIPKIGNKNVIIVDDILITGRTAHSAIDAILDLGRPSKIKFLTLIDVKRRELPLYADYVGWEFNIYDNEDIIFKIQEVDGKDGVFLQKKENV